jgi:hypothetical protein
VALQATTIASSIAGLTVTGVTMKNLTSIPENVAPRDCPIIYPKPDGFMSDLEVVIDSFGSSVGKKTVRYALTYMYLHSSIGQGRGLFDVYQDMVAKACVFLDAVIANDALTGSIDIQPESMLNFGPVADPAGNYFHGCEIVLKVMEFVN